MLCNYHTHTARCGHARGFERDYVEAAIRAGFKKLGFSDHVPTPAYDPEFPQFRMPLSEAPEYTSEINKLKEEYKNDIELFVGYECEYIPFVFDEHMKILNDLGCEYIILGQHFLIVDDPEDPYPGYGGTEDKRRVQMYTDLVTEGISTGKFSYVCHPDIFRYTGTDIDFLYGEYRKICETAKKYDVPLEFNMQGYIEHRHYPKDDFWQIAKEVGNKAIIGVDAHYPEFINADNFRKCADHLAELGVERLEDLQLRSII